MKWFDNKSISVRDFVLILLGMLTIVSLLLIVTTFVKLFLALFKFFFSCFICYCIIYIVVKIIRENGKKKK